LIRFIELFCSGKDCLGQDGMVEAVGLIEKAMVEHFKRAEERAGLLKIYLLFFR
jgi:hypothetical protein